MRAADPRAVVRAAARARVSGVVVTRSDVRIARHARHSIAAAIVAARYPVTVTRHAHEPRPLVRPRSRRLRAFLLLTLLTLLVALLVGLEGGGGGGGGAPVAAPEPEPAPVTAAIDTTNKILRGRSAIELPLLVAAAAPTATPVPTAAPTPEPTANPVPTPIARGTTTGGTATTGGTGTTAGGTGTGTGGTGGTAGGSGGGTATGTGGTVGLPIPTPTATPPVPPPGYGRLSIIVLDSRTLQPLPNTCIVIGTSVCDVTRPQYYTDARGRWSVDIPMTTATTNWDMYFIRSGYVTARRSFVLAQGRTALFEIRLIRR